MLRQKIAGTPRPTDPDVVDLYPGAFGTVVEIDDDQVTVSVGDYDNGKQTFGPVPFTPAASVLVEGDRVFLHFDHQGRPAYAATFT